MEVNWRPRAVPSFLPASRAGAALPILGARARKAAHMLRNVGPDGNLSGVSCPECGAVGRFWGHGSYSRTIVHRGREEGVRVRRVRCVADGCGTTHAVLPGSVVPYKSHSAAFVVAVLAAWAKGASNREVRESFGISESTRRRIVSGARARACALLACGASRAAVAAAIASAGAGALPDMHLGRFGARFAEDPRPGDPLSRRGHPT